MIHNYYRPFACVSCPMEEPLSDSNKIITTTTSRIFIVAENQQSSLFDIPFVFSHFLVFTRFTRFYHFTTTTVT